MICKQIKDIILTFQEPINCLQHKAVKSCQRLDRCESVFRLMGILVDLLCHGTI